jgi:hypothetical protein
MTTQRAAWAERVGGVVLAEVINVSGLMIYLVSAIITPLPGSGKELIYAAMQHRSPMSPGD